ncbi:MAG: hypothetical protein V4616_04705 [Bacteroidota bacterium]
MNKTENILKNIGYGYFAVFLAFAIYFFKERVIYIDSANQTFGMINSGSFEIFVGRYSMVFSQLLPLAAIKLGLSLRAVLLTYSASFVLVYAFCYYLCVDRLKNTAAGLVIVASFLSASHTFFHTLSESLQLIAFGALLFAWLSHLKQRNNLAGIKFWEWAVTIFLLLLNFFIHPVAFFTVVFLFVYVFFDYLLTFNKTAWILLCGWVLVFVLKALIFTKGSHDEQFLSELKNTGSLIGQLHKLYPVTFIKTRFFRLFLIPTLLWIIVQLLWIRRKDWKKIVLINAYILGFFILSLIIYNKGDSDHGMERTFLPFLFMIAIVFFDEGIAYLRNGNRTARLAAIPVMAVVIVSCFSNILHAAPLFSNRTRLLEAYIDLVRCEPESKFVMKANTVDTEPLVVAYGTALETMMLSALDNPAHTKSIFIDRDSIVAQHPALQNDQFYFTNYWPIRNAVEVNKQYFSIYGPTHILSGGTTIDKVYAFDFERLSDDKTLFVDTLGNSIKAEFASTDKAFSGSTSIKVGEEHPFGMECRPAAKAMDQLLIKVKRFGDKQATIVITDDGSFYRNITEGTKVGDWDELVLETVLPVNMNPSNLKIYVWNPGKTPAYFDDLSVVVSRFK